MQLARLEGVLEDVEATEDRPQARELLLNHVIEMAVEQRRMVGIMQSDPVIIRFLAEQAVSGVPRAALRRTDRRRHPSGDAGAGRDVIGCRSAAPSSIRSSRASTTPRCGHICYV
jgi:hypothetical protein